MAEEYGVASGEPAGIAAAGEVPALAAGVG
jgi:hypothetical protein